MTKVTGPARRQVIRYALFATVTACLSVVACGKRESPERELRRTMGAMQGAFKAGHIDDFMDHVAADFVREDGSLHRDELRRLVAVAALRNRDALIVAEVGELRIDGDRATVSLRVHAVGGEGGLLQAPVDVSTGWRRDHGDWKVVSADWTN